MAAFSAGVVHEDDRSGFGAGEMGKLLACVTSLEDGDFDRGEALVPDCGARHLESIIWANDAADPLLDQIEPSAAEVSRRDTTALPKRLAFIARRRVVAAAGRRGGDTAGRRPE
ncbi:MAG TPA: hypothetical protein VMU39_24070 [Solirubrobacteraceae bacterium]|nr:hypothetical protein [Solirubrobacteraceae bacterium]